MTAIPTTVPNDDGKAFYKDWATLWSALTSHSNSFRTAADILVDHYEKSSGQSVNHELMFPVLYCYRHYMELSLKDILRQFVQCGYAELGDITKVLGQHSLRNLWDKTTAFMEKVRPGFKPTEEICRVVDLFVDIDDDGTKLRYDRDKPTADDISFWLPDNSQRLKAMPSKISIGELRSDIDIFDRHLIVMAGEVEQRARAVAK